MSETFEPVGIGDIRLAASRIAGHVLRTPMVESAVLSNLCGIPVHLKLESQQRTGAFKLRGATNAVLSLSEDERNRGVVAASTGNHGRALAFAAKSVSERNNCANGSRPLVREPVAAWARSCRRFRKRHPNRTCRCCWALKAIRKW